MTQPEPEVPSALELLATVAVELAEAVTYQSPLELLAAVAVDVAQAEEAAVVKAKEELRNRYRPIARLMKKDEVAQAAWSIGLTSEIMDGLDCRDLRKYLQKENLGIRLHADLIENCLKKCRRENERLRNRKRRRAIREAFACARFL